ncbi:hypothetical protein XFLAVUS301_34740 [Xanthobacter flavus]|uniref:Uncharacterized protein n=1 Tax=Xanthobacter flavus TaxID=281 RepID=A0A9W6CNU0_XANFL|nr:hypothetical protein XFLAVUS301_34740 [Xanthobacter flavus]
MFNWRAGQSEGVGAQNRRPPSGSCLAHAIEPQSSGGGYFSGLRNVRNIGAALFFSGAARTERHGRLLAPAGEATLAPKEQRIRMPGVPAGTPGVLREAREQA